MLATQGADVQQASGTGGFDLDIDAMEREIQHKNCIEGGKPEHLVLPKIQVQAESARAASERLPGFDHELRRAAARAGGPRRPAAGRGAAGNPSEPPRGKNDDIFNNTDCQSLLLQTHSFLLDHSFICEAET